ncbi:MAG: carboxylesterase family protein [Planctomycetaceae bacterium]|nr:carboxylesterase family protein [Planctomycetaceae bacterium]
MELSGKPRRPVARLLAAVLLIAALCGVAVSMDSVERPWTVRETRFGLVRGIAAGNGTSLAWLGVPYAAPPVGDLRWQPPQDPKPWKGILATIKYPARAPQPSGGGVSGNEDCLYLNIWRPATAETGLPVMYYIHGGSNQTGGGDTLPSEKLSVAANAVVVSINYRLGALGWLEHPALKTGDASNDSGNWGLLDCAKALEWIRDNIAAFGGDPGNVTISGSSAGGRDCLALMISPIAKGLFHKAMIFCGGPTLADPALARGIADKALRRVVIAEGKASTDAEADAWIGAKSKDELAAYMRSVSADKWAAAMDNSELRMANFPHLMRDGAVLPKEGFDAFAGTKYDPIPILIGAADREFIGFAAGDPMFATAFNNGTLPYDEELLDIFLKAVDYGSRLYSGFNLDTVLEKVQKNPSQPDCYAYRLGWGLDNNTLDWPYSAMLGGMHTHDNDFMTGMDNWFVKNIYPDDFYTARNKPGRDDLSRNMMAYFRNFLHTGNPNGEGLVRWHPWTTAKTELLHFSADNNKAVIGMKTENLTRDKAMADLDEMSPEDRKTIEYLVGGRFFYDVDY